MRNAPTDILEQPSFIETMRRLCMVSKAAQSSTGSSNSVDSGAPSAYMSLIVLICEGLKVTVGVVFEKSAGSSQYK